MLKKTITYVNFNDEEVSEDFFFHLNKAELVELELSKEGGFVDSMQRIVQDNDGKTIIAEFKKIILMSYGKKSSDGKRFIKTQELRDEFESSEAYSTLFMEMVTNADAAVQFVMGIIPANLAEEAAELARRNGNAKPQFVHPSTSETESRRFSAKRVSQKDLEEMSQEELLEVLKKSSTGEVEIVD